MIQTGAKVVDVLQNQIYRVQLDGNQEYAFAVLSKKMVDNKVLVEKGYNVTIEMSPYDLTKGKIVYREKPQGFIESSNSSGQSTASLAKSNVKEVVRSKKGGSRSL